MFPDGLRLPYAVDPLEALRRWPADRPVVMLHSGRYDAQWSRYSVLAEPVGALVHREGRSSWIGEPADQKMSAVFKHDPFADLDAVLARDPALYVGHLGYDLAHAIESLPRRARADHVWPDLQFHRCPNFLLYDQTASAWSAIGPSPEALPDLASPGPLAAPLEINAQEPLTDRQRDAREAAVRLGLDYIAAGDVFQVNLAQRFTADFEGSTRG